MTGHEGIDSVQVKQASLLDEGYRDLEAKRNRQAVSKFRQAVSQEPKNGRAYQGLAQGLTRLRRYDEAEQASRTALALDPNLATAHGILAICFARQKHFPESHTEIDTAIRLGPNAASAFITLGAIYIMEDKWQDAKETLKRVASIDGRSWQLHYNLAICYSREKRFAESLHEARTAWRLAPSLDTGFMVATALLQRYPWLSWVTGGILFILLFTGRGLIALPEVVIVVILFFIGSVQAMRAGNRKAAAFSLLSALWWIFLCFYSGTI